MKYKLFRSLLFVPAYNERYITSAFKSGTDIVILDLEDSVPEKLKQVARENIKNIGRYLGNFKGQIIVRVNDLFDKKMLQQDFSSINSMYVDGVMIPKVESKEDILMFETFLQYVEGSSDLYFLPLIENAKAMLQLPHILIIERVIGLAFGGEDYLTDIGGSHGVSSKAFDYPRSEIVINAKAYNKIAIDTPYLNIDDVLGVSDASKLARELGFNGKMCIHPAHATQINKAFTPSDEEISISLKIVELIESSEANGRGVSIINGKMIGPPMEKRALNTVRFANEIAKKEQLR